MSKIWGIMKKELDKVLKNPRMFFSTLILPGLIIGGIYTFMGINIDSESSKIEEHVSIVHMVNVSDEFNGFLTLTKDQAKIDPLVLEEGLSEEEIKENLDNQVIDLYIVGQMIDSKEQFKLYYNQLKSYSSVAHSKLSGLIEGYHEYLLTQEHGDYTLVLKESVAVGDEQKESGLGLAMLLPMLVMTIVFSSSLGIGADVIAGEKERGTLATLLMAPITKKVIIVGKILSSTLITLLASIGSFIGIAASLPYTSKLFNVSGPVTYGVTDYISILLMLIAIAMTAVCLVLFASTLARTTKEASMYAMPVYIVAILASTISMFTPDLPKNLVYYVIPIYNTVLGLKGILSFSIEPHQILLILGSSVMYFFLFSVILVRLFHSEKILFSK